MDHLAQADLNIETIMIDLKMTPIPIKPPLFALVFSERHGSRFHQTKHLVEHSVVVRGLTNKEVLVALMWSRRRKNNTSPFLH